MKRIFTIILITSISSLLFSQGIVNNGAYLIMTSGSYVYVDGDTDGDYTNQGVGHIKSDGTFALEGDWANDGSTDVHTSIDNLGVSIFSGTTNQEIGGAHKTIFENLTINNSNTVLLTQNTDVSYNLTMTSGIFDLKDKIASLGANGTIVNETETNRVTSTDASWVVGNNIGTITATRPISGVTNYNPANLGIEITTTQNLNTITIIRGHEIQTGSYGGTASEGVARYYEVPGIGKLDVSAGISVNMHYWNAELNGLTESQIEGYHWITEGSSSSWWTPLDGSIDTGNDLFTTSGDPYDSYFTTSTWYGFTWSDKFTLGSKDTPLPVVLTDFSSECTGQGAVINWTTASEINNDYFILGQSENGIDYTELAKSNGAGNSNSILNYSFFDKANNSRTYYRLSQFDYNGAKTVYKLISQNCASTNNNNGVIIYPNPTNNNAQIKIDRTNCFTELEITDILGKTLLIKDISEINYLIPLQTSIYEKGVYNIILKSDNERIVKTLIKIE